MAALVFHLRLKLLSEKDTPDNKDTFREWNEGGGCEKIFPLYLMPFGIFKMLFIVIMNFIIKKESVKGKEKLS